MSKGLSYVEETSRIPVSERIVTQAVYFSHIEGLEGAIITKNPRIKRVAVNTFHYLRSSDIPEVKDIGEGTRVNRIKGYHLAEGRTVYRNFDSSNVEYLDRESGLSQEDILELDRQFRDSGLVETLIVL